MAREQERTGSGLVAPAAHRAALVLQLLGQRRAPVTVTAAARHLALPTSSVLGVLVSLEAADMVRRSPSGWLLGYKVLELGRAAVTSTELVGEFHRATAGLRSLSAETVLLAVLDGVDVIYLARHDGTQPVRYLNEVGSRMPAVVTALGRSMLAALPADELERRLAGLTHLPVHTSRSLRTLDDLHDDLAAVRERGHAVDTEQGVPGVVCFSVPVEAGGSPPTAVSTTLVAGRATAELEALLVTQLRALAARLRLAEHPLTSTARRRRT